MTRSSLTVIKVGGSLFDWPELPSRLMEFLDGRKAVDHDERIVLIAGGGAPADMVRGLDNMHRLGDETAHQLALHAMDFTAMVLAKLIPGALVVDRLDGLRTAWSAGSIPVLAPRHVLDEIERSGRGTLPATWDVTSDSIAAWLASYLLADQLVLLKSAPLPEGADRQEAARLGLVDPMLPVVAGALSRVEYLNLREREYRPQLLT